MLEHLSKLHEVPVVGKILAQSEPAFTTEHLKGFETAQELAVTGATEIASMIQPGWSEKKAAHLLDTYLRDSGVESFFHASFCWYGERTRFDGMRIKGLNKYKDFLPSGREYREGEVILLDVAPIFNGYTADIGMNFLFNSDEKLQISFKKATDFLQKLREEIPILFMNPDLSGADIYKIIDEQIKENGYSNQHSRYPLGVLGHRLHHTRTESFGPNLSYLSFGWQAYWSLIRRGLYPETLSESHTGNLNGLWAIEPHIGCSGFGVKFEEMLLVEDGQAGWLREKGFYAQD